MIRLNSEKIHDTVDAIILDKSETSGILTDHIMHGGHNLHVYLCQLFNSMLYMAYHQVAYKLLHWYQSLKINVRV